MKLHYIATTICLILLASCAAPFSELKIVGSEPPAKNIRLESLKKHIDKTFPPDERLITASIGDTIFRLDIKTASHLIVKGGFKSQVQLELV